jgi:K+-transporting ATPase ATPase B chain
MTAEEAFRNNIIVYGIGGLIVPFIGIKIIDMLLVIMGV